MLCDFYLFSSIDGKAQVSDFILTRHDDSVVIEYG
jgi:hypothetical protein